MTTELTYDANELLSRPILDLTEAEVLAVVEDLRKRRLLYVQHKRPDKAQRPAKVAASTPTAEEKRKATEDLLASIDWAPGT